MSNIHSWGISKEVAKAHFGDRVRFAEDCVGCGYISLRYLVSDCGSVTIANIRAATLQMLQDAIEYCRLSGYSLLIGTVTNDRDLVVPQKLGFSFIKVGNSHRHPKLPHYLVYLRIPEKKFDVKGYNTTQLPTKEVTTNVD